MSGDDDKTPMLEHELPVTESRDSRDGGARPRAGVETFRRSKSTLLAVVTFILFACALLFLTVGLIVPIFHSLNVLERQRHVNSTGNASSQAAGHSTDHHHEDRRSASHVVDTLKRILAVRMELLYRTAEGAALLSLRQLSDASKAPFTRYNLLSYRLYNPV